MESIVRMCLLMMVCTFVTGDDVVNGVCDASVSIPDPFKSCGDGYFSSASACLACPSNCLTCRDMGNYQGGCSFCKTGYMLSADQLSCSSCPTNCDSCSSNSPGVTICSTCITGYGVTSDGAACQTCPSNCDVCNSTDCFTCATGYAKAINGTCLKCPTNCDSCNSTTCFTCTDGYAKALDGTCQSCGTLAYKGCATCMDLLNSTTKAVCLSLDQCSKGESEMTCIRILVNCYHCNSPTECNENSTVTSCPVESGFSCWVIKTNCSSTGTCNLATTTVQTSYGCLNQTCSSPYTEETCSTQANGSRQCKRCCTTDKCNNPSGASTYFNRGRGGHVIQVVTAVAAMLVAYVWR